MDLSVVKRPRLSLRATARSLLMAFSLSGRFNVSVAMPSCLDSRIKELSSAWDVCDCGGCDGAGCVASLMVTILVSLRSSFRLGARDQLSELPKMPHALAVAVGILGIRLRQNIYARAVQKILLKTKLTFALRKLFERQLAVESNHMLR